MCNLNIVCVCLRHEMGPIVGVMKETKQMLLVNLSGFLLLFQEIAGLMIGDRSGRRMFFITNMNKAGYWGWGIGGRGFPYLDSHVATCFSPIVPWGSMGTWDPPGGKEKPANFGTILIFHECPGLRCEMLRGSFWKTPFFAISGCVFWHCSDRFEGRMTVAVLQTTGVVPFFYCISRWSRRLIFFMCTRNKLNLASSKNDIKFCFSHSCRIALSHCCQISESLGWLQVLGKSFYSPNSGNQSKVI